MPKKSKKVRGIICRIQEAEEGLQEPIVDGPDYLPGVPTEARTLNGWALWAKCLRGIIPSAISPYVLRAIGARQASRYFQSAERIDAARARDIGLVHETVEAEQLDAKVQEIVAALLQGGPLAQAAAKDLIRAVAGQPVNQTLVEDTAHRIAHLRATLEAREGIATFLEKRSPNWFGE